MFLKLLNFRGFLVRTILGVSLLTSFSVNNSIAETLPIPSILNMKVSYEALTIVFKPAESKGKYFRFYEIGFKSHATPSTATEYGGECDASGTKNSYNEFSQISCVISFRNMSSGEAKTLTAKGSIIDWSLRINEKGVKGNWSIPYSLELAQYPEFLTRTSPASGHVAALTFQQQIAIRAAKNYLNFSSFSKSGLIDQLKFEGYSSNDSEIAVNNLKVDWSAQAVKTAKRYLQVRPFSRTGLIEQLQYEGFTLVQAGFAANSVGL